MELKLFKDTNRRFGPGEKNEPNPDKCQAAIWGDYGYHQCGNKPKKGGLCGRHTPEFIAEFNAKQKAREEAETAERNARNRRYMLQQDYMAACKKAVADIAAGHNDARGLCEEIMRKYAEVIPS